MSAAWHSGLTGADQYAHTPALTSAISIAMDFWFSHDFTLPDCLDQGGTSACPCGTPGFWNTNWFSNVSLFRVLCADPSSQTASIGHACPQLSRRELLAVQLLA